jgi:hypothetical protein
MSTAQDIVRDYLVNAPEQSDWPWEDHCDGLAMGILGSLHRAGWRIVRTEPYGRSSRGTIVTVTDQWDPGDDFEAPA